MRGPLLIFCLLSIAPASAAPTLYVTWLPWEVDSAVTAWVLKRHVAPEARFVAIAKGHQLADATRIDMPDSPYRRGARDTAFDAALRLHRIDTPCTRALQPLVRILELTKWRKSTAPEAEQFEQALVPLLPAAPQGDMTPVFAYLDAYCANHGGDA